MQYMNNKNAKSSEKKRVTIKDVAQMAGVTPSTVSFVLNNTPGQTISEATRAHVLECAKKLNYRRHYLASSIRWGQSRTLAVVSMYKKNYLYFLDFINGVLKEADEAGYGVLICPGQEVDERASCVRYFQEGRIDGVLFISSAHSEQKSLEPDFIKLFHRFGIPFVVVYGYTDLPEVNAIKSDLYADGLAACQLLLRQGCARVGFVAALDKDNRSPYQPRTEADRIRGYQDALAEVGRPSRLLRFPRNFHDPDYEAVLGALREADCDGYVVCWATYGLQLLAALKALGKRVPTDVKVIALDSLPYLDYMAEPPLTAMSLPFYDMAREGTKTLIGQLSGKGASVIKKSFSSRLEMRGSV